MIHPHSTPTERNAPRAQRLVALAVIGIMALIGSTGFTGLAGAATTGVVAKGGADRIAKVGTKVVLDGRASTGATWYRWRQVLTPGATPVNLINADSAAANFVFPAGTSGVRLALIVTGAAGTSTDIVDVALAPTRAIVITSATWSAATGTWKVAGQTNSVTPVTIRLGSSTGPVMGTVNPDLMGRWSLTRNSASLKGTTYRGVVATSSIGSHQLAVQLI